jgi:hypothetical protein
MIGRILIPVAIIAVFILGAVTLMATAPQLTPDIPIPIAVTVRIQEVNSETVTLRVHSQGSVMPRMESQLIPEVSGRVVWMSPKLVLSQRSTTTHSNEQEPVLIGQMLRPNMQNLNTSDYKV